MSGALSCVSHNTQQENLTLLDHEKRLYASTLSCPIEEAINLLRQLWSFDLGRFLLNNKGLNGYWTSYLILYGLQKTNLSALEKWVLMAPAAAATRDRFFTFQKYLRALLKDNLRIASIPCGMMDDILTLDLSSYQNLALFGFDFDATALTLAADNAKHYGIADVNFERVDAWRWTCTNEFDVILSNGLNIYESSEERIIELYRHLGAALKSGGHLITSFMTPPTSKNGQPLWCNFDVQDIVKQKLLLSEIACASWQNFVEEDLFRQQLKKAGLQVVAVDYDKYHMFPTVLTQKL